MYENKGFEFDTQSKNTIKNGNNKNLNCCTSKSYQTDDDDNDRRTMNIWKRLFSDKQSNKTSQIPSVSYYQLFKYATCFELTIVGAGVASAFVMAFNTPLLTILYSEFISLLINRNGTNVILLNLFGGGRKLGPNPSDDDLENAILADAQAFGIGLITISTCMFILSAISVYCLNYVALKQIARIRGIFFTSVLKQDISWYDTNTNMNFASRITEDLNKMKDGMGEKIAIFTNLISGFAISLVFSFVYGWELTLVSLSCAPVIIASTAVVSKMQSSLTVQELASYGQAGAVAEEVFSSIRTVMAFSGEDKELERYSNKLIPATKKGQKKGFYSGLGGGCMLLVIFISYSIAFWYGISLILRDYNDVEPHYTPAVLMIVFFGVLVGAQNLGMTAPHLEAFSIAKGSAATIFAVINRPPAIDSFSTDGLKPQQIIGNIEFQNVHFQYPSRPDVKILKGFNLKINAGETVALVGTSGCGKSTIVQLLQRLYDPEQGNIYLDDTNIKQLNLKWLREHIGVVGQEPVLFNETIGTNIRYGRMNATQTEIECAAQQANCHDFIKSLPDGYDTMVTSAQLSGGQKQRIAIARALIRQPMLLLLDEATSALDLQSEAKVQQTLDEARLGRTTIIIAHRLSTITNADRIVLINDGVVSEVGSHQQLMQLQGQYYQLVEAEASMIAKSIDGKQNTNDNNNNNNKELKTMHSFQMDIKDKSQQITNDEQEQNNMTSYPATFLRILKINKPEWLYLIVGCISSILVGASYPAFAVLFGDTMGILSLDNHDEIRSKSQLYAIYYFLIGLAGGIATLIQTYAFNVAGVRLTTRLRKMTFSAMIKQETAWFDDTNNAVGALCSRLSGDASAVQGATGTCVGAVVQSFSIMIIGIVIGLYYSWKMGLLCIAFIPVVLASIVLEQRSTEKFALDEKKAIEAATKIAVEAISNIRTVVSLCCEDIFLHRYLIELEHVNEALKSKTRLRGIVFAFGQSVPFYAYAFTLWYGGYLVAKENLPYENIVKVTEALIFGAWMMGQALAFAPNFNAAKISANRIFSILDRESNIKSDTLSHINDQLISDGNIELKHVEFNYPTRPNHTVLTDLNLNVKTGQTVALVGFSGCGKSTIIQLIQRLYDPDSGVVFLDEFNVKHELSLSTLRKQLGIVSQEPVLFDRTISENIAYGDNSRHIDIAEIIDAAKQANIHNFINSLPQGYDTRLGSKGTQLSGGQKQRIAIARALIRQPRILLLDEATSALDRQSEKIVQEALDKARLGRTCITIAHRLITIQNADRICVVDKGRIVESGTHNELMNKGGIYCQMQYLSSSEH